jgi:hypothetical protein
MSLVEVNQASNNLVVLLSPSSTSAEFFLCICLLVGAIFWKICLINLLAISGNSKQFQGGGEIFFPTLNLIFFYLKLRATFCWCRWGFSLLGLCTLSALSTPDEFFRRKFFLLPQILFLLVT